MILCDPRNGTRQNRFTGEYDPIEGLLPLIRGRGAQVEETDLQFADFAFEGNGPDGKCLIGLERKRITDLINSIRTGRFSAIQLPGLLQMYRFQFLIVEGVYRPATNGLLEILYGREWKSPNMGSRSPMYNEVSRFLTTIQLHHPTLTVLRTSNREETAFNIVDQYHYFNSKEWSEHSSHQAFHIDGHVQVFKASLVRRIAKECYKVGWEKSKAIDQTFASVVHLANASLKEWEAIPGIGKTIATKIWEELRNGL